MFSVANRDFVVTFLLVQSSALLVVSGGLG